MKRKKRKKVKTRYSNVMYVIENLNSQVVLKYNNQQNIVRKANLKGHLSSLVSLIERKGYSNAIFDKQQKVINFKIQDVRYIWSKHCPNYIFMYNELHNYIQGIIPVTNVNFKILTDLFKSAHEVYLINQKLRRTNNDEQPTKLPKSRRESNYTTTTTK